MPSQKKKSKIIVTGGFGYIGSRLIERLEEDVTEYISIDKLNPKSSDNCSLNLQDKQIITIIKKFTPDVIVHCGTHSALTYKNDFINSFREDFESLLNILDSIKKMPNSRLIFFSSSYVYSGLKKLNVKEDESLLTKHNFGVAKHFFEEFILRNHSNSVVFRLSSVFGAGNSLHPNVILNMVKECQEKGKITVWGTGSRKMQFILIEDVVEAIIHSFPIESGIYNLGGDDYLSIAETAKRIADFFQIEVDFIREKPEGETLPFMSTDKLKKAFKRNSFTPIKKSLPDYLNHISKNKND